MKKRTIAFFIAAIAAVSTVFGGCSCSGDNTLAFPNLQNAKPERLSYKVEYVEEYGSVKKSDALDKYFTSEYSTGSYTSELKTAAKSEVTSNILNVTTPNGNALVETVYLLTTDFEIDLKVTINGTEYAHTEKITTKAYIADSGASFAPLYAKEDAEYAVISVGKETRVSIVKSVSETFYDKDEYRTVKKAKAFAADAAKETITLDGAEEQETTTKYSFRSAIDNAELLFAMRGLKIEEKAAESVNAVWSAYESPQPLKITNTAITEKEFRLKYNGDDYTTEKIKYASLSFAIDKTNASGMPQYVSVQTEAAGNIKNTCLLLEYVKPLIVSGEAFASMGALKFTLDKVVTD